MAIHDVEPNDITLATPCVRNCCLDSHKVCLGCGRSLPEILEWHRADSYRQEQIKQQAEVRLTQFQQA